MSGWEDLEDLELPWLCEVPIDEPVEFLVDPRTATKGENKKGWGCLYLTIRHDGSGWEKIEVPFWCMRTLAKVLNKHRQKTNNTGVARVRFTRTVDDDWNSDGSFEVIDSEETVQASLPDETVSAPTDAKPAQDQQEVQ